MCVWVVVVDASTSLKGVAQRRYHDDDAAAAGERNKSMASDWRICRVVYLLWVLVLDWNRMVLL